VRTGADLDRSARVDAENEMTRGFEFHSVGSPLNTDFDWPLQPPSIGLNPATGTKAFVFCDLVGMQFMARFSQGILKRHQPVCSAVRRELLDSGGGGRQTNS
jgi:hypothetical protein